MHADNACLQLAYNIDNACICMFGPGLATLTIHAGPIACMLGLERLIMHATV